MYQRQWTNNGSRFMRLRAELILVFPYTSTIAISSAHCNFFKICDVHTQQLDITHIMYIG